MNLYLKKAGFFLTLLFLLCSASDRTDALAKKLTIHACFYS